MTAPETTKQVLGLPDEGFTRHVSKRARVFPQDHEGGSCSYSGNSRNHNGGGNTCDVTPPAWQSGLGQSAVNGNNSALPPVPETPPLLPIVAAANPGTFSAKGAAAAAGASFGDQRGNRSSSPAPSCASSSALSVATTTATALSSSFSRRASLSSCRSSFTNSSYSSYSSVHDGAGRRNGSRRSSYRSFSSSSSSRSRKYPSSSRAAYSSSSGDDFFPKPLPSRIGGVNRRRREVLVDERRDGRNRFAGSICGNSSSSNSSSNSSWDRHFFPPPSRRSSSRKDYASEASTAGSSSTSSGRKRNRSCSRERSIKCPTSRKTDVESCSGGVKCERCLEWCRSSRSQKSTITRTLQMDYYVRTPRCKAAKCKHINFIDEVAYSREQFIEETVFTCPFTGARRDTVLERNMFPYDVPSDVEHWTLWSRKDLSEQEMEAFVQGWAVENHPHAVEWEYDNNEGERSIDWFHVHVFFRLGCGDRTGVPRDPDSAYDGPYRRREEEEKVVVEKEEGEKDEEVVVSVASCGASDADVGCGVERESACGSTDGEDSALTDSES